MRRALSVVPKLSSAEIAFRIKRMHEDGEALNISAVREKHPELLLAAYSQRIFLGWRRALELAGLDYSKIKIHLPPYVVCQECQCRLSTLLIHIPKAHSMSLEQYREKYPGVATMAPAYEAKHFGPRRGALPHWEPHWSPEYVLDRIYQFYLNKIPLAPGTLELLDKNTAMRAWRYFRNWETALKMVKLNPEKYMRRRTAVKLTRDDVRRAIRARHQEGHDVSATGLREFDRRIVGAADRLFGSHERAIRACGLDPALVRRLPKPLCKYKTETNVIDGICRRRLAGKPIYESGVTGGAHKDLPLWNKGRRLFGSWPAAIRAAGFDYEKITLRPKKYQTPAEVIFAIQLRQKRNLPLTSEEVLKGKQRDHCLRQQGLKFFKNWARALKAAGIRHRDVLPNRFRYPTRESVVTELQRRMKNGLPLDLNGICYSEFRDWVLLVTARKFFGSWFGALSRAGISVPRVRK